jgi:CRP-like cAMP-binding protein
VLCSVSYIGTYSGDCRNASLVKRQGVYEAGETQHYVYFPTDCIVSLLYVMKDGASAEISVVGNDGIVGVALFMGGETTRSRAAVQSAGNACRLLGRRLKEEFYRHGKAQLLLLRYTQALQTQMAQTAVCNRHHEVEQQLCRWTLSLDRLQSNQLNMTEVLIANMLGVRRGSRGKVATNRRHSLQPRPADGIGPA